MTQKRASIQAIHPDSPWTEVQKDLLGEIISYEEELVCETSIPCFYFVHGRMLTGPLGPLGFYEGAPIYINGVRLRSLTK